MILQQNKYAMALRDDDLRHIQFQLKNSRTEKAKVSIAFMIRYFHLFFWQHDMVIFLKLIDVMILFPNLQQGEALAIFLKLKCLMHISD